MLTKKQRRAMEKAGRARRNQKVRMVRDRQTFGSSYVRACRLAQKARDIEVATRLYKRFYHTEQPPPDGDIREDLKYWHLRKLGYDVCSDELRRVYLAGQLTHLCAPIETAAWRWWMSLHPKQRASKIWNTSNRLLRA